MFYIKSWPNNCTAPATVGYIYPINPGLLKVHELDQILPILAIFTPKCGEKSWVDEL